MTRRITTTQREYLEWLAVNHPPVYQAVYRELRRDGSVAGIDDLLEKITGTVEKVAPALIQAKQQRDLLKVQTERAKKNLPPLDVSDYTPGVKVGMDDGTKKLLAGLGVGALVLGGWALNNRSKAA